MQRAMMAGVSLALLLGVAMYQDSTKPRGIRNNNPLNIRADGDAWQGAIGDDGAFVVFDSPVMGIRAAARTMKTYRDRYGLNTIAGLIDRWAPDSENDTNAYIDAVVTATNIPEYQPLSDEQYPRIIAAMIHHENGQNPYHGALIEDGFKRGFYA